MVKRFLFIINMLVLISGNGLAQNKPIPEKPKLIISIFIEGMRYDYLYHYWDYFSEGGFKALVNKGMFYKNAEYKYLYTKSSCGYATFVTGTNPSQHGIVNDIWYKQLAGQKIYCTYDANVEPVGTTIKEEKHSPRQLLVSTFSDELKLSNFKQSKVISISVKDYAAVLPAGHLSNGAYWMDKKTGNWISSTYYFKTMPSWVSRFNEKKFPQIYLSKTWETFLPFEKYTMCLGDDNSFEEGFMGIGKTFPYIITELKAKYDSYDILNTTPFGNTYTKDFAVSAIVNEELGKDEYCDYLNISFTANENISRQFSIRSMEMADAYIRLDRDLEHFLNFVNDYVGMENTVIILTSDRGSADSPKLLESIGMPGGVFKDKNAETLLESYLNALYHVGDLIDYFDGSNLYLKRDKVLEKKLNLGEVQRNVADFLVDFTGVANALTSEDMESRNFNYGMALKAQNSYHKKHSGDISVILEPGFVPGSDVTYGSGYKNFTHVPLIFYGWKIKKGESDRPVSMEDIAPTLSRMLNIAYPGATTGSVLEEIVK